MENPKWVDGQKSILEQKSMSMEEEKCKHEKYIEGQLGVENKYEIFYFCEKCGKNREEEKDTSWEARFDREFVTSHGENIEPTFNDLSDVGPVKQFIRQEREALLKEIVSGIEDMQTRVRLEQFTVDEIVWLIKKKI